MEDEDTISVVVAATLILAATAAMPITAEIRAISISTAGPALILVVDQHLDRMARPTALAVLILNSFRTGAMLSLAMGQVLLPVL
jgi:hypothetical protein